MKEVVTNKAPGAVGPYSQGIVGGNTLYISGQLPINPQTGELISDIKGAAKQALENIIAIAETVSKKDNIVRTTVYMKNIGDFPLVNEVYAEIFTDTKPSRVCVEVSNLPKGALLEIEAIAIIE